MALRLSGLPAIPVVWSSDPDDRTGRHPHLRQRSDARHHRACARRFSPRTPCPQRFFAIGRKLATPRGQALGKRVVSEGHLLGGHTWSHSLQFGLADEAVITRELADTSTAVDTAGGDALLFRPYGAGGIIDDQPDEHIRRDDPVRARVHVRAVERGSRRLARRRLGRASVGRHRSTPLVGRRAPRRRRRRARQARRVPGESRGATIRRGRRSSPTSARRYATARPRPAFDTLCIAN